MKGFRMKTCANLFKEMVQLLKAYEVASEDFILGKGISSRAVRASKALSDVERNLTVALLQAGSFEFVKIISGSVYIRDHIFNCMYSVEIEEVEIEAPSREDLTKVLDLIAEGNRASQIKKKLGK